MLSCSYQNWSEVLTEKDETFYNLISEWLETYHSSNNKLERAKAKTLIVTKMIPIVKHIARTIARRANDPIEDMIQAGSIGLLKAIDSYSKDKNDNFKIYAGYLIIGEMKHYLRDRLNAIRVPRHIQELSYRISNFTKDLTVEELNDLTNEEVASALQISPKDVDFALQMDRRKDTISLEDVFRADKDSLNYEELLPGENYKETTDITDSKILLNEVINKLPEEQKTLVGLYYYKDMNQKEIAEELNLTQMQVSRRMKRAFTSIYKMIAELEDAGQEIKNG